MFKMSVFVDFDKKKKTFYNNLYLEEEKLVIKMPLINSEKLDEKVKREVKVEKFDLTKYTYLLPCP